ncbi:MAG: phage major capsid protein [Deltaproteobacteria bacterium]|nr:phage major capsid protein [Deltaproteobacteria bacterium]
MNEKLKAALGEIADSIPKMVASEIEKKAAAMNKDKRVEMVFGAEKKGINDLTPEQLLGQWYLYKVLAGKQGPDQAVHIAKAQMLAKQSWLNSTLPYVEDIRQKALTESTEGADLTPVEYIAQMIEKAGDFSELMPHVRRVPVTSDTGTVPKEGSAVTRRWNRTEAAAYTASDPAYGQITFTAYECYLFTEVSYYLLQDSPINVIADVTRLFTQGLIEEQDKMVAIGAGTTQPTGIASATITQSVSLSNSITYAGLIEIKKKLPAKYRKNARWIGNTSVIDEIAGLVDLQNRPIFERGIVEGQPATIAGFAYSRQDDFATDVLYLGDLMSYMWFDRMKLDFSTESGGRFWEQGTTGVKMVGRFDGKVALEDAFALGKDITGV